MKKSMEGGPACHIAGYNKVQVLLSQSCVFISLKSQLNKYWRQPSIVNRPFLMLVDICSDLEDSVIVGNSRNYLRTLRTWLSPVARNVNSAWKLCWRASVDGWASSTFHSRCDGKGPTVTIIRVGKCIFGGYTRISWGKLTLQKEIILLLTATSFVLRV